jgi:hypothetical protein
MLQSELAKFARQLTIRGIIIAAVSVAAVAAIAKF